MAALCGDHRLLWVLLVALATLVLSMGGFMYGSVQTDLHLLRTMTQETRERQMRLEGEQVNLIRSLERVESRLLIIESLVRQLQWPQSKVMP